MKKLIIFIAMLVVFSSFSYANVCTASYDYDFDLEPAIRRGLRLSLYTYLANPERMDNMDKNMLSDAVDFYFQSGGAVDCEAQSGSQSGQQMKVVLEHVLVEQLPSEKDNIVLPTCEDGTPYGECSDKRPYFCLGGELVELCMGPDEQMILDGDKFKAGEEVNLDNCGCPDRHIEGVIGKNTAQFCIDSPGSHFGTCDDGLLACTPDCPNNIGYGSKYCKDGKVYRLLYYFDCIDGLCREVWNESVYMDCTLSSKICKETGSGPACVET